MPEVHVAPSIRLLGCVLCLLLCPSPRAEDVQVVDTFEAMANPNGWNWTNVQGDANIAAVGGNPGAWVDTDVLYFATHPHFISVPPANSALRTALASGRLLSASIDLERLDESTVVGCQPTHLEASFVSLALFDSHSADVDIQAHTTVDASPPFPEGPFPWFSARFDIPQSSLDVPDGWRLNVPIGLQYTWADLLRNVDGIRFYVRDPEQHAFSACSHLGADNVIITYAADDDFIFDNGFDVPAAQSEPSLPVSFQEPPLTRL